MCIRDRVWAEREGKYTAMDGRILELKKVLQPKVPQDREILIEISKKLGRRLTEGGVSNGKD